MTGDPQSARFVADMTRVVPLKPPSRRARLAAVLAGRCPRCGRGRIFRGRLAMNAACPVCGLRFERESGYFTGAMYLSYALTVPVMAACVLAVQLVAPRLSFEATIAVAALLFLPFVPALFRYSRILWIHFDQTIDPAE
jgi:uncharacterized protein (DUF983 family)